MATFSPIFMRNFQFFAFLVRNAHDLRETNLMTFMTNSFPLKMFL